MSPFYEKHFHYTYEHSFPTRRSSDLGSAPAQGGTRTNVNVFANMTNAFNRPNYNPPSGVMTSPNFGRSTSRSEEHTSELQSPCNLVCRLLLEKKNNKIK